MSKSRKRWSILYIPNGTYILRHGECFFLTRQFVDKFYEECSELFNETKVKVATISRVRKPQFFSFSLKSNKCGPIKDVVMSNLRMDCEELLEEELEVVEYPYD